MPDEEPVLFDGEFSSSRRNGQVIRGAVFGSNASVEVDGDVMKVTDRRTGKVILVKASTIPGFRQTILGNSLAPGAKCTITCDGRTVDVQRGGTGSTSVTLLEEDRDSTGSDDPSWETLSFVFGVWILCIAFVFVLVQTQW